MAMVSWRGHCHYQNITWYISGLIKVDMLMNVQSTGKTVNTDEKKPFLSIFNTIYQYSILRINF